MLFSRSGTSNATIPALVRYVDLLPDVLEIATTEHNAAVRGGCCASDRHRSNLHHQHPLRIYLGCN